MGLFDKIQDAANDYAEQQSVDDSHVLAAQFPGQQVARTDLVRVSPRFRHATVAAYLATVGLPPEDVYAVIPELSNDVAIAFHFVYRDRPEYEAGRARWAADGG